MASAKDMGYDDDFTPEELRAGAKEAENTGDKDAAKRMRADADKLERK